MEQHQPKSGPARWPIYLGVAATTLVGALFRVYRADHSLRLDELTTAWVVETAWGDIASRAWLNNHSPAYFYVVKASVTLFGYTEMALRLPSLLAGVAIIPLFYFLTLRVTRSAIAGLLGTFLVAADSIFIEFAQDARAYGLLQLLAVVQVLFFLRLLDGPTRAARAGFIVCTAVLLYLHYTTAILVLGEATFVFLLAARRDGSSRYGPVSLITDGLLVAALCLPLVPHLRYLFRGRTVLQQFMRPVVLEDLLTLYPLDVYILFPAVLAFVVEYACRGVREEGVRGQGSGVRGIDKAAGAGAGTERSILSTEYRVPSTDPSSLTLGPSPLTPAELTPDPCPLTPLVFLCCWFAIPITAVWLANRFDVVRLFRVRYTIVCSPVPILAAALVFTLFRTRVARLTYVIIVLLLTQATEGPVRRFLRDGMFSKHYLEDWRGAVGYVRAMDPAGVKPVFVRSGLVEADWLARHENQSLADYCLSPVNSLYPLTNHRLRPLPYSSELGIPPTDRTLIEQHAGAWLVVRGSKAQAEQIACQIGPATARSWTFQAKEFRGVSVIEMVPQK